MPKRYFPSDKVIHGVSEVYSHALKALGSGVRRARVYYNPEKERFEADVHVDTGTHVEDGFQIGQGMSDAISSARAKLLDGRLEPKLRELIEKGLYIDNVKF